MHLDAYEISRIIALDSMQVKTDLSDYLFAYYLSVTRQFRGTVSSGTVSIGTVKISF